MPEETTDATTAGTTPASTDTTPPAVPETVTREEHQRELDRYRNELGGLRKDLKSLQDAKAALEAASQTEAEKLAARAKRADELEPEVETLRTRADIAEAALVTEADAQAKLLPKDLKRLYDKLPACDAAAKLEWLRDARETANERAKGEALPPSGGRNPGQQKPNTELTDEDRKTAAAHYASRW